MPREKGKKSGKDKIVKGSLVHERRSLSKEEWIVRSLQIHSQSNSELTQTNSEVSDICPLFARALRKYSAVCGSQNAVFSEGRPTFCEQISEVINAFPQRFGPPRQGDEMLS